MTKTFDYPKYYKIEINEETGDVSIFSNSKRSLGRNLTVFLNTDGYLRAKLNNKTVKIHSLVALFYLGEKPLNYCVNHKDGNKLNNRPSNLEYVTIAENIKHAVAHGLHVSSDPKRSGRYKDGRCGDLKKYKREWYIQKRNRMLQH